MIWSVAWRNIWRNPFRSGVIIAATAIGMFAGIFSVAFLKGWMNQRLETGVETEFSHLQLHHPSFSGNCDLSMFMPDGIVISDRLRGMGGIDGSSPRLVLQTMVSSAETSTGVKVIGIYPEKEKTTSNLYTYVSEGKFLEGRTRNPVVIGKKLAEKLKVKLKSKIVIKGQDSDGNLIGGAFVVSGIYDIINNRFEESNLFVRYKDILEMVNLPDSVAHEITVHITDPANTEQIKSEIAARYTGVTVLGWQEMTPEFGFIIEVGNLYALIIVIVVLLALSFAIVNTMLMAVLERIKELGMLMAVGMSRKKVFSMLMLETVLLTFTGGAIGIAGGILFTFATHQSGIDLTRYAKGFEAIGRSPVVYPELEFGLIALTSLLVILTGIAASVYPAGKAMNYNPADALRIDM
jgi:ABC-type lipoprotein release transport system permease subunit